VNFFASWILLISKTLLLLIFSFWFLDSYVVQSAKFGRYHGGESDGCIANHLQKLCWLKTYFGWTLSWWLQRIYSCIHEIADPIWWESEFVWRLHYYWILPPWSNLINLNLAFPPFCHVGVEGSEKSIKAELHGLPQHATLGCKWNPALLISVYNWLLISVFN
jgi:hypothetical protein